MGLFVFPVTVLAERVGVKWKTFRELEDGLEEIKNRRKSDEGTCLTSLFCCHLEVFLEEIMPKSVIGFNKITGVKIGGKYSGFFSRMRFLRDDPIGLANFNNQTKEGDPPSEIDTKFKQVFPEFEEDCPYIERGTNKLHLDDFVQYGSSLADYCIDIASKANELKRDELRGKIKKRILEGNPVFIENSEIIDLANNIFAPGKVPFATPVFYILDSGRATRVPLPKDRECVVFVGEINHTGDLI
jgi:hypothetical protein